jgi:hypothetical protein
MPPSSRTDRKKRFHCIFNSHSSLREKPKFYQGLSVKQSSATNVQDVFILFYLFIIIFIYLFI